MPKVISDILNMALGPYPFLASTPAGNAWSR
jgi:hypothetical protein